MSNSFDLFDSLLTISTFEYSYKEVFIFLIISFFHPLLCIEGAIIFRSGFASWIKVVFINFNAFVQQMPPSFGYFVFFFSNLN